MPYTIFSKQVMDDGSTLATLHPNYASDVVLAALLPSLVNNAGPMPVVVQIGEPTDAR